MAKTISINMNKLKCICTQPEKDFRKLGVFTPTPSITRNWWKNKPCAISEPGYIFIDNGANILAVAHLDYNNTDTFAHSFRKIRAKDTDGKTRTFIFNGALDDRLGAFVILELFKLLKIKVDILLTTNEEIGATTAAHFVLPENKTYNWMIQFDRRGTDVVMYQYDTPELKEKLEELNIKVGQGSFSCIAALEHLGIAGFNWGTGYYFEHTQKHFAIFDETLEMVAKFHKFYEKYKDTKFIHIPKPKVTYTYVYPSWKGTQKCWKDDPDFLAEDEWKQFYDYPYVPSLKPKIIIDDDDNTCPSLNCPHFWSMDGEICGACNKKIPTKETESLLVADRCPMCGLYITTDEDLTVFAEYALCAFCASECFDTETQEMFTLYDIIEFIEDIYDEDNILLALKGTFGHIVSIEENPVEIRVEAECVNKKRMTFRVFSNEIKRILITNQEKPNDFLR